MARRSRPCLKPLNMRNGWHVVGPAHAALLAIDGEFFDQHHFDSLAAFVGIVGHVLPVSDHRRVQVRSLGAALADIERRETVAVTSLEAATIRTAMSVLLPALDGASNMAIHRACTAMLAELDKHAAIPGRERTSEWTRRNGSVVAKSMCCKPT